MYMPIQVPYIYRRGTKRKIASEKKESSTLEKIFISIIVFRIPMLCNRNRELKDKASSCLHETQLRKSDDLL